MRLSGPESRAMAAKIFRSHKPLSGAQSHTLLFGKVIDPTTGEVVDEALLSVMRAPHSYTREDVVEINCHGGMAAVRRILELVLTQGARLARPGEFTKRAFLNGRIDLTQAEAVADLITAVTADSLRIAAVQLGGGLSERLVEMKELLIESCALAEAYIDFPEEEIDSVSRELIRNKTGRAAAEMKRLADSFGDARYFREGLSVGIVGRPNVGKSSLLNALVKKDRAIVTEFPGTTRDLVEEYLNIEGLPVKIIDTAGIRRSDEAVEREGIKRSRATIESADFIIAVLDGAQPLQEEDYDVLQDLKGKNAVMAVNKSDLPIRLSREEISGLGIKFFHISAKTGEGIRELEAAIYHLNIRNWNEEREGVVVTNVRHKAALDKGISAIERALGVHDANGPVEIFSIELRDAIDSIGEITGAVTTEDILNKIFDDFCIGK